MSCALFPLAELLLDRLHLLVQVVLALALLHLRLTRPRMRFSTCRMSISPSMATEQVLEALARRRGSRGPAASRRASAAGARRWCRPGGPASSMPASEVRISGGIFLFSFTYWSNCGMTERAQRLDLAPRRRSRRPAAASRRRRSTRPSLQLLDARALHAFDQHLDGAVGQLQHLQDRRDAADRYMSSAFGSSSSACFCATSMMRLSASIAASSALIDFWRPTNSGITMCGNTTTSRSGSSGTFCDAGGGGSRRGWFGHAEALDDAMESAPVRTSDGSSCNHGKYRGGE